MIKIGIVHCHVGSLEKSAKRLSKEYFVHCHVGSLESLENHKR